MPYGERIDGRCSLCGGEWPEGGWPFCRGGHGKSVQTDPFRAYFDEGIGEEIMSLGQRHQEMRKHNLKYREHPTKGDLAARLDKIADKRREMARNRLG